MRISVCPICGKIFEKNGGFHHVKWCKDKKEFLTIYELNSSNLEEKLNEIGSVLAFREKYPFKSWFIQYYTLFSEFGINTSIKRASNLDSVKNKRKNTSIINTGESHNFNKNHPSRKKWENKLYLEEGITNVFQRESVKLKSAKTFVNKYKTERWKHALTVRGKGVISSLNKIIFSILEELNISFEIEFKILKNNKISYYSYDILLSENKIIEINGDYWHCNPLIYKPTDLFLKGTINEITAAEKWKKDKEKIDFAKSKGFNVLVIWEKEINENLENVKDKILKYEKS